MKLKTILSALILASMLASGLASCSNDETSDEASDVTTADTAVIESAKSETTTSIYDTLPTDLDYNGADVTLHVGVFTEHLADPFRDFCVEEPCGDVVDDAVYERNKAVEEALNVKLNWTNIDYDYSQRQKQINYVTAGMMAGDDSFDAVFDILHILPTYITYGGLVDMSDTMYINFENPWWAEKYNDVAVVNGKQFFATGDIVLGIYQGPYCMFFNTALAESMGADDPYTHVNSGTWTIDTLGRMVSSAYSDINGSSDRDDNDRYGLTINSGNDIMGFMESLDMRIIELNDDFTSGEYLFGSEHNVDAFDAVYRLMYENPGVNYIPVQVTPGEHIFLNGNVLFNTGWLSHTDFYRDTEFDYGIIPYPKFDESQEEYYTRLSTACHGVAISVSCADPDMVSAVLEFMAAEGYRDLRPAYLDTALKEKYSRDETSKAMIDLIIDGVTVDFINIYTYTFNNASDMFKKVLSNKSDAWASTVEARRESIMATLESLLEQINA